MKLISVLLIMFTLPALAQVKGAYFRLGQTILATSGASYSTIEDNIYANEVAATACTNKLNKLALQESLREKDIKDCNTISKKVFLKPDNTGFQLADFLGVGCIGTYKKVTIARNHRSNKEETETTERKFESRYESSTLKFRDLNPKEHERADFHFFTPMGKSQDYITLNQTYDRKPMSTYDPNNEWNYQYKISEGTDKKLIVDYVLDSVPGQGQYYHTTKITVNCISKTLDEMNEIAKMYED